VLEVSILVVLDQPLRRLFGELYICRVEFQSLLSWISLFDRKTTAKTFKTKMWFQSLLSWISLFDC